MSIPSISRTSRVPFRWLHSDAKLPTDLDPSPENAKNVNENWPSVTPETAEDFVKTNVAHGADYIKLMQENGKSVRRPFHVLPSVLPLCQDLLPKLLTHPILILLSRCTSPTSPSPPLNSKPPS